MISPIIQRNISSLQSSLSRNLEYIDINHDLQDPKKNVFGLDKGSAIVNAYKLWLKSDVNDYCRQPEKGGFLRNNLNRYTFSPDSEPIIVQDLIEESGKVFPFIEIVDCEVKCEYNSRTWVIKIIVRDKITGIIGNLYSNGLVIPSEN